jgi:phosphate:Na+ symporter
MIDTLKQIIFPLIGGFGFFLFGMKFMTDSFQKMAGTKLRVLLHRLSANRFIGLFSGTAVTALIQSSTATTVMVVGFVNAGLMNLSQSISLILGANIGTTITAQIIAFKVHVYALPLLGIGALIAIFGKREKWKFSGEALFGFGSLFYGVFLMGEAFAPLRDNPALDTIFAQFSAHPLLGVLAGATVTAIVQSSSITTGITIALAQTGVISFGEAVPIIIGQNIGTTITANLAAMTGGRNAKAAARAHFIINVIGAGYALLFMQWLMKPIVALSNDVARQVAHFHTLFNVLNSIVFLPFIDLIGKAANSLVFTKKQDEELFYLEDDALAVPDEALDRTKRGLVETLGYTNEMVKELHKAILTGEAAYNVKEFEQRIYRYEHSITRYIEKLSKQSLPAKNAERVTKYIGVLHEIERISDYSEKLDENAERMASEDRNFSKEELKQLRLLFPLVEKTLDKTKRAINLESKELAQEVIKMHEEKFSIMKDEIRNLSRQRALKTGEVTIAGIYFDSISSLEEITKKCRNIAYTLL